MLFDVIKQMIDAYGAPYSVSGITCQFSCSKTPKLKQIKPRVFRDFSTAFRQFACFKRLDINNVISNYTFDIHFCPK